MGGTGSGNWTSRDTKSTVEDSLVVAAGTFRGRLFDGAAGRLVWNWSNGHSASISYAVAVAECPIVVLLYTLHGELHTVPVLMQSTATQFGGQRWWFTCPLTKRGRPCGRRVGKLYSPPGARYFGCRTCHNLTYESCRESHRSARLYARIFAMLDKLPS